LCKKSDVFILGIETSCDETAAAVVKNGREMLSNVISSQIDLHRIYGGVVPEIASRKHVELLIPVIEQALKEAGITGSDLDGIAVTYGPGLVGALLVGLSAAKALCISLNKPLIGVNHIHGHIAANYIEHSQLQPKFVCLIVSGGHSHIVIVRSYTEFEVLGHTRDDAVGEAFDKVARILNLGYPGGPEIDNMAKLGSDTAIEFPQTTFKDSLDFSFSGLKTAVINYVYQLNQKKQTINVEDICASFQKAAVEVLVRNTLIAAKMYHMDKIVLAGGVAANSYLRNKLKQAASKQNISVFFPRPVMCTDNAVMIGCAGYYKYIKSEFSDLSLNAISNLKI